MRRSEAPRLAAGLRSSWPPSARVRPSPLRPSSRSPSMAAWLRLLADGGCPPERAARQESSIKVPATGAASKIMNTPATSSRNRPARERADDRGQATQRGHERAPHERLVDRRAGRIGRDGLSRPLLMDQAHREIGREHAEFRCRSGRRRSGPPEGRVRLSSAAPARTPPSGCRLPLRDQRATRACVRLGLAPTDSSPIPAHDQRPLPLGNEVSVSPQYIQQPRWGRRTLRL